MTATTNRPIAAPTGARALRRRPRHDDPAQEADPRGDRRTQQASRCRGAPVRRRRRAPRPGARRHPRPDHRLARRQGRGLHPPRHPHPAHPRGRRPRHPAPLAEEDGVRRRHRDAQRRQDPREHGDRPQRPARPVGLDARPRHPLHDVGVGLRHPGRRLEAHPQRPAPHVDQRAGQGQGRGLLDAAHGRRPAVAPLQHPQPRHQRHPRAFLRVGHRDLRPRARGRPERREVEGRPQEGPQGPGPQGGPPVHEGLRRDPARRRPLRLGQAGPHRHLHRERRSATSGRTRSSSAATSPTASTPSPRRRSRARPAATGTSARCSARPTSPAASSCTS